MIGERWGESLRELDLSFCRGSALTSAALARALQGCQHLRSLALAGLLQHHDPDGSLRPRSAPVVDADVVAAIFGSCPELKTL